MLFNEDNKYLTRDGWLKPAGVEILQEVYRSKGVRLSYENHTAKAALYDEAVAEVHFPFFLLGSKGWSGKPATVLGYLFVHLHPRDLQSIWEGRAYGGGGIPTWEESTAAQTCGEISIGYFRIDGVAFVEPTGEASGAVSVTAKVSFKI